MSKHKDHKIFFAIIENGPESHLAYQINPSLTIGLDPRNDVVVSDEEFEQKHIELKDKNGALILIQRAADGKTLLNGQPLKKDEQYLLSPNDKLKIGSVKIKFKKDVGLRAEEIVNTEIHVDKIIHSSDEGINLIGENPESKLFVDTHQSETIIKKNHHKKEKEEYLVNIEPLYLKIQWDFVTKFFLGLIFDFFFAYFILSLLSELKIHIFLFFSFIELILMFTFKSTAGQFLFKHRFNRQFSVWILLILFIIFPLTQGGFTKKIIQVDFPKTNVIDIHAPLYSSKSTKNNFMLETPIDNNYFLLPELKSNRLSFEFIDSLSMQKLSINFIDSYDTIKLNKFIFRTHPMRLPIKSRMNPLEAKNRILTTINFDRKDFKNLILNNGPFLAFINDAKSFFIGNLGDHIESVVLPERCPIILLRNKSEARLFFMGNNEIYYFSYLRPTERHLEDIFIEKFLAKIRYNLLEMKSDKIGFLEMFDSLPEADLNTLYKIFEFNRNSIIESKGQSLIDFYNQIIDQASIEVMRESRNAGPNFIQQLEKLKI